MGPQIDLKGLPGPEEMGKPKAGRRFLTLQQRVTLMMSLMVVIVAIDGLRLFQSMQAATKNIRLSQQAAEFANQLSELQLDTLAVTSIMDTFSLTRPTEETQLEMNRRLSKLNERLADLQSTPFGLTPEMRAENQQILADLSQVGLELRDLSNRLYLLASQNRWGAALRLRQTQLGELQEKLSQDLKQLQANLRTEVAIETAQVQILQNQVQFYSMLTILGAMGAAGGVIWFARRTVVRPVQELTAAVKRIAQADWTHPGEAEASLSFTPLERDDEIGELSRAMAVMTDRLRESHTNLAERVAERTRDLEQRNLQIQVAGQVARDIASMRDLESLLFQAVTLIRERFGFYHASLFLNDPQGEYTILRASTGEAGRVMLQQGHRLKIGEVGMVGYAASTGEVRVALDVNKDSQHVKNPLLPLTRSEAALPLRVAGMVIGVLDVQSAASPEQEAAFDESSVAVLQVLADQLAIAIQNARLLEDMQANLQEMQTIYGHATQQAWTQFLQGRSTLGYEFDGVHLIPIQATDDRRQMAKGHPTNPATPGEPFSIPLRVRGMQVGTLDIWPPEGPMSEAEVYLLASISSRLSQVLESARLYEDAQARTAREQTLNRLVASVARALDSEEVLQVAAEQLGQLPGVSEAAVYIGGKNEPGS